VSFPAQAPTSKRALPMFSAAALAIGLLALAGCGSSSSNSTSTTTSTPATTPTTSTAATTPATTSTSTGTSAAAGSSLSLAANAEGQLAYSTKSLTANAGKVSIDFTNMSPLAHNVTIESSAGKIIGATPTFQGGAKTLTLELKAGTYKFFCSVPGHRMAGMEGTLTVK
jgi:plastocyanin